MNATDKLRYYRRKNTFIIITVYVWYGVERGFLRMVNLGVRLAIRLMKDLNSQINQSECNEVSTFYF